MTGQRFVHRVHQYDLGCPGAGPRFLLALVFLAYGLLSAGVAAIGWTGQAPDWVSGNPLPSVWRIVLVTLGALLAVHGPVLAAEQLQRGWALLGQRSGAFPVIETAGPCRLVQAGSSWDLHLALTDGPLWSELGESRERDGLYFALGEADVAQIARIFDPGDEVAVRWVDLPAAIGGPTLLGLRAAAREERLVPLPGTDADTTEVARAA